MTLDALTLVAMVHKEPTVDAIAQALGRDANPRVPATALAEAGIILAARGETLPAVVLQIMIDRLHLTVVPFSQEHWREAIKAYESRMGEEPRYRPRLGRCLTEGVAAKLGARVLIPDP